VIRRRYCVTCGLLMSRKLRPLNRFDTYTGQREVTMTYVCPNKRWFTIGHWDIAVSTQYEAEQGEDTNGM
jgi:hypothetical protein